jgi:tRNA (guanine37-N1)-methyltransferase
MEYVRIAPRNADKARKLLLSLKLLDTSRTVIHSRSYVYFPTINITHQKTINLIEGLDGSVITKKERKTTKRTTFEEKLEKMVGKKEVANLSRGYDQLGDIAIIDYEGSKKTAKIIAGQLLKSNKTIKTVLVKAGAVAGKYRVRKVEYLSGVKNFIATYKENGCIFRFDVRKVYFSNRLSFERSRILKLVKEKENVMVMFSGVGPFPIEIAKMIKSTNVIGIELNPNGHKYALENVKLNKIDNIKVIFGDVKNVSRKYKNFADRIIMPLPMSSLNFLDDVYIIAKKSATIHLYAFSTTDDPFEGVYEIVKAHAKKNDYSVKLLDKRIVRPYSSTQSEVVLDYLLKK